MIAHIISLQDQAQFNKPKIAEIADIVARYFVAVILAISFLTWWYWHQTKPEQAFWIMLSVLVATCPCALSLATPTALTCAAARMGGLGILLRKSHVFETLCKVNHLVVDKTGTLTQGDIEIHHVSLHSRLSKQECLSVAAALESHSNHPIARAFKQYRNQDTIIDKVDNVIGFGLQGHWQNQMVKIGSAEFVLNREKNESHAIYLSIENQHVATFYYQDPIRKESQNFIQKFAQAGINTTLLTGDTLHNAQSVAQQVGIEIIIAGATPEQKLAYLNQLNQNHITMMVGDGINDAPTLAGAHLSVAMGGGTDIAKASADMTLLGDNLEKLLQNDTFKY